MARMQGLDYVQTEHSRALGPIGRNDASKTEVSAEGAMSRHMEGRTKKSTRRRSEEVKRVSGRSEGEQETGSWEERVLQRW